MQTVYLILILVVFHFTNVLGKQDIPKDEMKNKLLKAMKFLGIDETNMVRTSVNLNESRCFQDIKLWFNDLKNREIWALKTLDVQSKIGASVLSGNRIYIGGFEECLNIINPHNFTNQYCLLSIDSAVIFNKIDEYKTVIRQPLIYKGICVPSSCSREHIETILQTTEFPLVNKSLAQFLNIKIEKGHCHKPDDQPVYTTFNFITIYILCSILGISLLSTTYELSCIFFKKEKSTILSACSMIDNSKILFSYQNQKNAAVEGWRALNSFLIVSNHIILLAVNGNVINATYITSFVFRDNLSLYFQATFHAVDSFLTLAGVNSVIKYFSLLKNRKEYDPLWEILQRYIRFTIPTMLALLIRSGISEHFHTGPIYQGLNDYTRKRCPKSFWSILFCFDNIHSNLVDKHVRPRCLPQIWHLGVDMQLFTISQIILIAGLWKKELVWKLSLILCGAAAIVEFYIGYAYDLGPSVTVTRSDLSFEIDYSMPYTRAAPWFTGMISGYLIYNYEKRPTKTFQTLMWILTIISYSFVYFGIGWFDGGEYTQPSAALFLSSHRILWGFANAWTIYALWLHLSETFNKILSWGLFNFYGRLAFEIFITHLQVIQYIAATARDTAYFSIEKSFYHFIPVMFYSTLLAIPLALMVTIPCQKMLRQCSWVRIYPISCTNQKHEKQN